MTPRMVFGSWAVAIVRMLRDKVLDWKAEEIEVVLSCCVSRASRRAANSTTRLLFGSDKYN